MKKFISYIFVFCSMFLLGQIGVNANFWNDYFNGNVITANNSCGRDGSRGIADWMDHDQTYIIDAVNICDFNEQDKLKFSPTIYSNNLIFNDVTNIKAFSSNEKIIKAEVKDYDYSREKAHFNNYVKWYNSLTLEEFNKYYKESYPETEVTPYKSKPTWWEYNGYGSEQKWWKAYYISDEPQNAVEVITHAYDLGKAYLVLIAEGQEKIKINWTIKPFFFSSDGFEKFSNYPGGASTKGLIELLNNTERYGEVIARDENYSNSLIYYFDNSLENSDISGVINAMKDKDIFIDFSNDYFDLEIHGSDIKEKVNKGFSFNVIVTNAKHNYKKAKYPDKINALANLKNPIYIDFAYNGKSQIPLNLDVYLPQYYDLQKIDDKYKCDKFEKNSEEFFECEDKANVEKRANFSEGFSLLKYDYKANKLKVVKKDIKLDEEYLQVNLTFDDFSNYVLVRNSDYETYDNKSVNSLDISGLKNYAYTGKNIKPNLIIKDGNKTLVKDIDYKISYKNNKNIGTATVTITGKGRYIGKITKKFKIVTGTPKDLVKSKQDKSSITIKWSKSDGSITGYEVYYFEKDNGKYKKATTITKSKTTSYKKTKLKSNKEYYFKVRAYKTIKGKKYYSSYTEVISATTAPKEPSIKVSSNTNSSTISWNKISGATSYEVYQSTDKKKYTKLTTTSELSCKVENLKSAKTYYYKVRAIKNYNNSDIKSSYSKVVSTTTKPLTPVITVSTKSTSATIKWDKISGASGYEVYQSKDGKKYSKIKTITKGSTTSYTKKSLSKGKEYYYKVRAYKKDDSKKVYSSYSNIVMGITAPAAPTGVKALLSGSGVVISYKEVKGVTGYELSRSKDKEKGYVSLGTTKKLKFKDINGEFDVKYYYKVRSYKEVNGVRKYSEYSKIVSRINPSYAPTIK